MTGQSTANDVNEGVLAAILDRLIPAVGDLPSAGQMGLASEVIRLAGQQDRFRGLFVGAMQAFELHNPAFVAMGGDEQDQAISSFEADSPRQFGVLRDIGYIVYYRETAVHKRIGWESRPPQPEGNVMTPWDESVLENIRNRTPFWRKV